MQENFIKACGGIPGMGRRAKKKGPKESTYEITKELEKVYKKVNTTTASTGTYDVKITTGLRKGATAMPSATATSKASPTATPKGTVTPSPTPKSPTPTASATPQ